MKTVIKLLIAAAVVHATFRAGQAAWGYYEFKDAAQQTVVFGYGSTTSQLHEQIVRRGAALGVPVDGDDVTVTRDGQRTFAEVTYTQDIELLPRYRYPYTFAFKVDAIAVDPITATDRVRP